MKCKLKPKELDCNQKEVRFESESVSEGNASKLDELVIMDTVAYVLLKNKELVFMKGSVFNEPAHGKDYDNAFSLVSPVKMAPMVILLSNRPEN